MTSRTLPLLAVLAALAACAPNGSPQTTQTAAAPAAVLERDVHSYARPGEARVTHVDLDLRTDFAAKRLIGTAALDIHRRPDAQQIVLDTRDLTVSSVADGAGRPLEFTFGEAGPDPMGRPLHVKLRPDTRRVVVAYETAPGAAALQWLTPAQTAGKRHPYLFSQGQAILTRSWIPTQDSPGIRQTYSARITVPEPLRAVMSAEA
ncbi:MAG TPA: aminopeptidase, partial [Caulobacteraceae bacterium]